MEALDQYLATVPEARHPQLRALDALIREAAPGLQASIKWGNLTYHRQGANVCALVVHQQHVNLQLWQGATLPDPQALLTGSGKGMRHIKLPSNQDFDAAPVAALVRAAASSD